MAAHDERTVSTEVATRFSARNTARAALHAPRTIWRFWSALGPGVVTGAADDDPSGIATYSIAGAQFGMAFLWTALLTWPLMAAVQTMCARIGMVTGKGLMAVLEEKFPRPILATVCFALFVANTLNVGSDLAGMADAAEMLTGVNSHIWVLIFGAAIAWATIRLRYAAMANVLKWLALVLLAYVVAAFYIGPQWGSVWRATITPTLPRSYSHALPNALGDTGDMNAWATLVAILGTTISPYLFFWQASQEVEEEKALGRHTLVARRGATPEEIRWRKVDVGIGTLMSNVVMFFIILTTALTLHVHGITRLETSRDVAEALRPLAGRFATLLYTIGLLGTGALAIPTLSGSAAYAFAELFNWRQGIDEHFRGARAFYLVILVSLILGVGMDFANVNAVQALYWTAIINGLLAPVLLIGILAVASDRLLMHEQPSSRLGRGVVAVTTVAMTVAAIGMFVY